MKNKLLTQDDASVSDVGSQSQKTFVYHFYVNVCVCYYDAYRLQHLTVFLRHDAGHFYHQTYFYVLSTTLCALPGSAFSCVCGVGHVWFCVHLRIHFFLFSASVFLMCVQFHHLTVEMSSISGGQYLFDASPCIGRLCFCLAYIHNPTNHN